MAQAINRSSPDGGAPTSRTVEEAKRPFQAALRQGETLFNCARSYLPWFSLRAGKRVRWARRRLTSS